MGYTQVTQLGISDAEISKTLHTVISLTNTVNKMPDLHTSLHIHILALKLKCKQQGQNKTKRQHQ